MHVHTNYCRVSGDYGFLIDSCCTVHGLQSKSIKKNQSIDETEDGFLSVAFSFI